MEQVINNNFLELDNSELNNIDGGAIDWLAIAAGAGTVWVLYEIGYAIGKGIAHLTS